MESTQPILLCRYSYDPLDRLISQLEPDTPIHQRFYCKSRLATEIHGTMRYSIVQHGDQLLAQQRSEGYLLDSTLLATDQQRSVLRTLKADHPSQPTAYSPYGHRPLENGLLSLLGFNGERPDPVTGCCLLGNGYRAFNPVLMRFNSPDSLSPFGKGGLNAYAYCAGDPINRADPTGHGFIKNLVNVMSRNTTPIAQNTIDSLRRTKKVNFNTTKELRKVAAAQGTSPEKILIEQTINSQLQRIGLEFRYLENPGFKITDTETIHRIYLETTADVYKHVEVLRELRHKNKYLLNDNTLANANKTLDRANQFLNDEALRVTEIRIKRFNRNNVLNYTSGAPPHYEEQLFPSRSGSPSASNNQVRGG
ncbi:RHS repeat-associated core domain-containing protein [Pseudomonas grandcourensis]|uniref:RHS repeat-associated core domain-containing protein n=1 Tax=Pseudomonas grandcourensis TaxID=3136736 RepID=UPI003265A951